MELVCSRCPFAAPITNTRVREVLFPEDRKKVSVVRMEEKTQIVCEKCGHDEATVHQMQTRSADEGSTIFYTCTKCAHKWKIN